MFAKLVKWFVRHLHSLPEGSPEAASALAVIDDLRVCAEDLGMLMRDVADLTRDVAALREELRGGTRVGPPMVRADLVPTSPNVPNPFEDGPGIRTDLPETPT